MARQLRVLPRGTMLGCQSPCKDMCHDATGGLCRAMRCAQGVQRGLVHRMGVCRRFSGRRLNLCCCIKSRAFG
eukprot:12298848-Heterocapsa_arctica.AAC.1